MEVEACLLSIEQATAWFDAHPHENVLEPMAHAERKRYLALRDNNGRIVASATLESRPLGFEQVGGIYLLPELRRQGLGRVLLDCVARDAQCRGRRRLVLGSYRREPDVSPFYKAVGFRTWISYIPGAQSRPGGRLAALLAQVFRVEAGPDAIRVMVRKL